MSGTHPKAVSGGETCFSKPAQLFMERRWVINGIRISRTIVIAEIIPLHLAELIISAQVPALLQTLLSHNFIILASKEVGNAPCSRLNEISKQEGPSSFKVSNHINKELAFLLPCQKI